MCGVIGTRLIEPDKYQLNILLNVMRESSIRGRHSHGVSWFNENGINTETSIGAMEDSYTRLSDLDKFFYGDSIRMIGHTRYSTSDPEVPQPINTLDNTMSVVMNGVITQEPYEDWQEIYGFSSHTSNDTGLILSSIENLRHPLQMFPEASMAVCVLDSVGQLSFFRNGKRPLWYFEWENGVIAASTKDILMRSSVCCHLMVGLPIMTEPYIDYTIIPQEGCTEILKRTLIKINKDLQLNQGAIIND